MQSTFVDGRGSVDVAALFRALDLAPPGSVNAGVYDGEWRNGGGAVVETVNPATNQVIGRIHQVRNCW